ncbi:hypothetical protein [Aminivibrio sp.]|uniref:hypothetical protein n=1 Tax=Aminivibrio sp. TaxID=1872489 RepID=UPI003D99C04D
MGGGPLYGNHYGFTDAQRICGDDGGRGERKGIRTRKEGLEVVREEGKRWKHPRRG